MSRRTKLRFSRFGALLLVTILVFACSAPHPIVGKWRTDAPTSLLFEYLEDGSVMLVEDSYKFVVFHYEIIDEDSLQLYDGMGRLREYDFRISGDTLTFYDNLVAGKIVLQHHRAK
jgi:predicted RNA-binding protein associated with RNAse of E/G family